MQKSLPLTALTAALLASAGLAHATPVFNRIATFPVSANIPKDMDAKSESSAEIIAASADGRLLVYTDSPLQALGLIDISDPRAPQPGGIIKLEGEPTSVAVKNGKALVAVNTSASYTQPSGLLAVVELASKSIIARCDLGGQPDSIAISPDGSIAAIAIENERDEDLNDGEMPQLPAGNVVIFSLQEGVADCASMITVDVSGLADIASDDPEPEFVDIKNNNEIVVTLQENNHLLVLDASGKLLSHASAGAVDLANVDVQEEGALTFDGAQQARLREPDAVKWLDDKRFVTANEGDYQGGSRSFTIFNKDGSVAYESGLSLEYAIAQAGHYPEKRSGNKGTEPEGVAVGSYGDQRYIFIITERASIIGVYRDTGQAPEFVQLLPSGIAPESAVTIPQRNLFVSANEADLVKDGGVRAHVMLYELAEGTPAYPQLVSATQADGRPIGWGALSGLAADPQQAGKLYAVNDSFYRMAPSIYTIDASQTPALITRQTTINRAGSPAQQLDLEGIAVDGQGGFWLASEGRSDRLIPHAIYHVNSAGEIKQEINLPKELLAHETRFGFEGITTIGSGEDLTLLMALQREWQDDPKGLVKLVSYKPSSKAWGAVHYPLDSADKGWVGLSEITAVGDTVYILERDNQIAEAAKIKKLYKIAASELQPAKLGTELPVVKKELVRDLLPDLRALHGFVVDKVEGFTVDAAGDAYIVTDNDGVDDSSGETLFIKLDKL
ncbi:MAG: esterase-like activity of phytase family protein [Gammaproteobacteria bacterium]